jgi:hypothetical protein
MARQDLLSKVDPARGKPRMNIGSCAGEPHPARAAQKSAVKIVLERWTNFVVSSAL